MGSIADRTTFQIRQAIPADAEALGAFGADLIRLHHAMDSHRFIAGTARTPSMYGDYLTSQSESEGSIVLVAEREQAVVGYVFARVEGPDYMALRDAAGVIHDIYVAGDHRGNGAGRALLVAALAWLGERRSQRVVLSTAYKNEAAQRLFKSAGFRSTMIEMTRDF